jgi:hypothetical protein
MYFMHFMYVSMGEPMPIVCRATYAYNIIIYGVCITSNMYM